MSTHLTWCSSRQKQCISLKICPECCTFVERGVHVLLSGWKRKDTEEHSTLFIPVQKLKNNFYTNFRDMYIRYP